MRQHAKRWGRGILTLALAAPLAVVTATVAASPASAVPACWIGPAAVRGNVWYLGVGYAAPGNRVATSSFGYGLASDQPFFGHWDQRSSIDAPGVVRGATWFLRRTQTSGPADITFNYGRPGDIHVVGDWNNDGITTPGVVRGQTWYLRNSNTGGNADVVLTFTAPGSPVVSQTFGQGSEIGTFDAGTWYFRNTLTSGPATSTVSFGQAGDIPLGYGNYAPAPDCTSPSLAFVRGNVWHVSNNAGGEWTGSFGRVGDHFLVRQQSF